VDYKRDQKESEIVKESSRKRMKNGVWAEQEEWRMEGWRN
jgi:hypothetical protein